MDDKEQIAETVRKMAAHYQIPHGLAERAVDVGLAASERALKEALAFINIETEVSVRLAASLICFAAIKGVAEDRLPMCELGMLAVGVKLAREAEKAG